MGKLIKNTEDSSDTMQIFFLVKKALYSENVPSSNTTWNQVENNKSCGLTRTSTSPAKTFSFTENMSVPVSWEVIPRKHKTFP